MADSLPAFPPPAGDIVGMDATTLAAAVRARRLSCVEVMGAFLDRIDQVNPTANAIVARRDRDALIAEARHHDERLGRGDATGPLYGLPIAVKDLDNVKGIRTTMGSPIFRDWVPATDSLMVKRLRAAGAIIIGKTNTPEFGLGSQTYNPVYGATRNAYDPSRTAGGSSGGAAVALALDMLPVADGSD
jgi:amidase